MSDVWKVFFTGAEEFAKTMKEHSTISQEKTYQDKELIERVAVLTERVERLVSILEEKLGTTIDIAPVKGKRMMDIKERIHQVVEQHPKGIRPPQIARILGTRVQNLYPHLKLGVQKKALIKSDTGSYTVAMPK